MEKKTDIQTLEQQCREWAAEHLGTDFRFREYQLENIVASLDRIINETTKINVTEAPTGSGKSIIAIVTAGVAYQYYRMRSYILVSDISLLDQYIDDFNRFRLGWGYLKGNAQYTCTMNFLPFQSGMCRLQKVSPMRLLNKDSACAAGFPCAMSCEAIQHRRMAMSSPVTLMTYQLYFYEINRVKPMYDEMEKMPPFDIRNITICDECHKIPEIIQSLCAPVCSQYTYENTFKPIVKYATSHCIETDVDISADTLVSLSKRIFNASAKELAYEYLNDLTDALCLWEHAGEKIAEWMSDKANKADVEKDKDSKKVSFGLQAVSNLQSMISFFNDAIKKIGVDSLVVNGQKAEEFTLNCTQEGPMVNMFFTGRCKEMMLLSATVGSPDMFRINIGAAPAESDFMFSRIPSTFDFTNSPIYIMQGCRMSWKEKDQNFPNLMNYISMICEYHKGQHGLIHTGNYEFSKKLLQFADPSLQRRLISYEKARDKHRALDEFKMSADKIISGPSLVEGVNFPDDMCRFIIIMKVPYASLADKLVQAKSELIPGWYQADTANKIIQALGRGIRHKTDWCITYILDGCFMDLYYRDSSWMPPEFIGRMRMTQ